MRSLKNKKDAPKAGDGNQRKVRDYPNRAGIKKMPLKQGTETFSIQVGTTDL